MNGGRGGFWNQLLEIHASKSVLSEAETAAAFIIPLTPVKVDGHAHLVMCSTRSGYERDVGFRPSYRPTSIATKLEGAFASALTYKEFDSSAIIRSLRNDAIAIAVFIGMRIFSRVRRIILLFLSAYSRRLSQVRS